MVNIRERGGRRKQKAVTRHRLETEHIDAAFVYIGDTDEVAHATSTYAPEYKTARAPDRNGGLP